MLKLTLLQNALHNLHHGIEHLHRSDRPDDVAGRFLESDEGDLLWVVEHGDDGQAKSFTPVDFNALPAAYDLKFAVLHLIQATELLLKSYIFRVDRTALFKKPGFTVGMGEALHFAIRKNPSLFSPNEVQLILEAKLLRNKIEHYEFRFEELALKRVCVDFLAVCCLIPQRLLGINLPETFSWDYWRDREDPIGDYLGALLLDISNLGRLSASKAGEAWAAENSEERVFLCWRCGAKAVSFSRGICMGCGSEANEEMVEIAEDFRLTAEEIRTISGEASDDGRMDRD